LAPELSAVSATLSGTQTAPVVNYTEPRTVPVAPAAKPVEAKPVSVQQPTPPKVQRAPTTPAPMPVGPAVPVGVPQAPPPVSTNFPSVPRAPTATTTPAVAQVRYSAPVPKPTPVVTAPLSHPALDGTETARLLSVL